MSKCSQSWRCRASIASSLPRHAIKRLDHQKGGQSGAWFGSARRVSASSNSISCRDGTRKGKWKWKWDSSELDASLECEPRAAIRVQVRRLVLVSSIASICYFHIVLFVRETTQRINTQVVCYATTTRELSFMSDSSSSSRRRRCNKRQHHFTLFILARLSSLLEGREKSTFARSIVRVQ